MKKLFLHFFDALLNDEEKAKRWLFGMISFLATLASMVFAEGVDAAFTWSARQWIAKTVTAIVAMAFGMVNPTGKLLPAKGEPERPAGFVQVKLIAALGAGVLEALVVGAALHSFGWNAHGFAVVPLALGFGAGVWVYRKGLA